MRWGNGCRVRGSGLARGVGRPLITCERGSAGLTGSEGSMGGGAAHKNIEAPRSIDGSDARKWYLGGKGFKRSSRRGIAVFSYRKPSPRGEGAQKGRIGHWRYESERGNAFQAGDVRQSPSADFSKRRCPKVVCNSLVIPIPCGLTYVGANPASLRLAAPSRGRGERMRLSDVRLRLWKAEVSGQKSKV